MLIITWILWPFLFFTFLHCVFVFGRHNVLEPGTTFKVYSRMCGFAVGHLIGCVNCGPFMAPDLKKNPRSATVAYMLKTHYCTMGQTLNTAVNVNPTLPTPLLPHCMLFQWGPLCMETWNIFLETSFFFCQRVACILSWERRGLVDGRCITLMWARCYSSRLLECKSTLKETQCCRAACFPKSEWLLSCTFSGFAGGERALKPFQVFSPRARVSLKACVCVVYRVFPQARDRDRERERERANSCL